MVTSGGMCPFCPPLGPALRIEKLLVKLIKSIVLLDSSFLTHGCFLCNDAHRFCLKRDVLMTRASLQTVVVASLLVF